MAPHITDEDKEQKRQQILSAAISIFAEKGYEKTTINDITNTAGVSHGTFYLYFDSKQSVLLAVAESVVEDIVGFIAGNTVASMSIPVFDQIEYMIDRLIELMQHRQAEIRLMHSAVALSVFNASGNIVTVLEDRILDPVADWIQRQIDAGNFRKMDSKITSYLLVTLIHDVVETMIIAETPLPVDKVRTELIGFIKAALGSR